MLQIFFVLAYLVGYCAAFHGVGKNYSMVLVGGGLLDNNTEIWSTIIELGGGKGVARFGVVATASEDPCCDEDSSWVFYQKMLTLYGAAEVYFVPVTLDHPEENSNAVVVEKVQNLTGFFFGGGDQTRVIKAFYNNNYRQPSPVLQAIKESLQLSGGVVAGTSAGTDCQTEKVMITGGMSYQAIVNGSTITWEPAVLKNPNLLSGYGSGGIGFFSYGLLETHFANRGRHGRLVQLLKDTAALPHGSPNAFAMDENTALVVTGPWDKRQGEVLGQRGAWVFQLDRAVSEQIVSVKGGVEDSKHENDENLYGVRVSRLSNRDVLDFTTFSVVPAAYKTAVKPSSADPADTSRDVFGEGTFEIDRIIQSLFASSASLSTYGTSKQQTPVVTLTVGKDWSGAFNGVKKDASSASSDVAVAYGGTDPESGEYAYSFSNLWMSLTIGGN